MSIRSFSRLFAATTSLCLLMLAMTGLPAWAQAGAPGFDMTGLIQKTTVDNPSNKLSGGDIMINNHLIRVPANSIVQLPATSLGWGEVFSLAPSTQLGAGESGLAMSDITRLTGTYEAHVQGNIVGIFPNQQYIAGLIFIWQESLNSGQGSIESIDYANREIHVNGTRISINDPTGRFSGGTPHSPDQRFAIDEENPTIRTVTAYPMCLPAVDPAIGDDQTCPRANRPKASNGAFLTNFESGHGLFSAPGTDPTKLAPFEPGDFITYQGVLQANGSIAAYQIIDNLGLYTTPGADPAYVAIDVLLQGTGASPNQAVGAFGIESTSKVVVEGFSTDPTRTVDVYAMDNLCGTQTDRWWATIPVDPGPPTGAKKGRFRYRPAGGAFLPPAREARIRVTPSPTCTTSTGTPCPPTAAETHLSNGLVAGQYHSPDFTFVFPETLTVGGPPATFNLGDFVWLVNGSGAWNGAATGRLDPWPDNLTPTTSCSFTLPPAPTAPVASALANPNTAPAGATVTLDGTASKTNSGDAYLWQQTSGTATVISNASSITALIVVPPVSTTTSLGFKLTISNSIGTSSANVTVTVTPRTLAPVPSATASPASATAGTSVILDASGSNDPNVPSQLLTFTWKQIAGPATVPLNNATAATSSFTAPASSGTYQFQVTVTNASGLFSAATVSVNVSTGALSNPIINSMTASTPVSSGGSGTLAVTATDPNLQALTYKWVQTSGPAAHVISPTSATTAFTAPTLAPGSLGTTLTYSVTVTDKSLLSATARVSVTVDPPPDRIQFLPGSVVYRTNKARLQVTVTDAVVSSNITVTCFVPIINPATNQPYTATTSSPNGSYSLVFNGIPVPPALSCYSNVAPGNVITTTAITVR